MRLAYLCSDLLFVSKIRETAVALGYEPVAAHDPAGLQAAARQAGAVIVDLRRPDALAALDALAGSTETRNVPSLGFCDHQLTERMDEARQHGCGRVLAKGKFSADLRHLLPAV